jgi:hypothetical protein
MITEEAKKQLKVDAKKAHDILSDKKKWAQGYYAYDRTGITCDPRNPRAVCWCAWGIIEKVARGFEREALLQSAVCIQLNVGSMSQVVHINDQEAGGYEKILGAYKAIAEGA